MTPSTLARGRFFAGFLISAARFAQLCQPPYAKRIGTSAVSINCRYDVSGGLAAKVNVVAGVDPRAKASATKAIMPATLAAIRMLLVHLPARTPTALIAVSVTSVAAASTR